MVRRAMWNNNTVENRDVALRALKKPNLESAEVSCTSLLDSPETNGQDNDVQGGREGQGDKESCQNGKR